MPATTRIRHEIHVDSDLVEAPAGTRTIKKVPAATPTDALHRLVAYTKGAGTATYYVDFECTPTPNAAYSGHTANGVTEPAGAKWTGELKISVGLKRREAIPKLNRVSVNGTVLAKTPASIDCEITLASRSTVLQTREPLDENDPRHLGKCTLTFSLTP